jgi:predicted amidohydrolase YtcJ
MYKIYLFLVASFLVACGKKQVDTIIHNATIYTVDSAFTTAEAMAIKEGKIIFIGSSLAVLEKFRATEIIDAQKEVIYPGFIDGHAHFVGYGQSLFQVNLFGCKSREEAVARVQAFAQKNPQEKWIRGRGWDQNLFQGKQFPTNQLLNLHFPNTPVLLTRVDGHAAIANAEALKIAGIQTNQTLTGGSIEVKNGVLTGLLIDNAVDLVSNTIPAALPADYEKWLMAAQQNCFKQGLTTITDCGLMYTDIEMIDALQKAGKLQMNLYVMLSDHPDNYRKYLNKTPYQTDKLYVKGVKVYADGALGSRGACLLQHYADKPGWGGFLLSTKAHFDSIASMLASTPYQMCTHAIGDSANRAVLNIYAKYLKGKNDQRWRIEHAQVVNKTDFDLFGTYSIIPSVQPTHATSDMYWASERLGPERLTGAYAYSQLLKQNGWLPLGTDFPVEDISPFKTFLAAVFRADANGYPSGGFQPENAISRQEALRGMTIWAAKANFMELDRGSLEPGKRADFIWLDKDLMQVKEKDILSIQVKQTWVDGKKVY